MSRTKSYEMKWDSKIVTWTKLKRLSQHDHLSGDKGLGIIFESGKHGQLMIWVWRWGKHFLMHGLSCFLEDFLKVDLLKTGIVVLFSMVRHRPYSQLCNGGLCALTIWLSWVEYDSKFIQLHCATIDTATGSKKATNQLKTSPTPFYMIL